LAAAIGTKKKNNLIPQFEPSATQIAIAAFSMEIGTSITAVGYRKQNARNSRN